VEPLNTSLASARRVEHCHCKNNCSTNKFKCKNGL